MRMGNKTNKKIVRKPEKEKLKLEGQGTNTNNKDNKEESIKTSKTEEES